MRTLKNTRVENQFGSGLTYKRDIRTRTALLEVLTRILRQGEVGGMSCFDALHSTITTYRFQRLVELVTMLGDNGELPIANALANVVHMYNQVINI